MGKLLTRLRPWERSKIDNTTQRPRKNGNVEGTYLRPFVHTIESDNNDCFPHIWSWFQMFFGGYIKRTFPLMMMRLSKVEALPMWLTMNK